jgi:hypothetical protein
MEAKKCQLKPQDQGSQRFLPVVDMRHSEKISNRSLGARETHASEFVDELEFNMVAMREAGLGR